MKVLVTGGCGFLGSHICELFKEKGWEVVAYDNMSKHELLRTGYDVEAARNYNYDLLKEMGILIQKADIRNFDTLMDCTKSCDYIIHTAAQPAMTIALEQPRFDFDNNALGTLNVLEVARKLGIPVAICSSIHVYGNGINNLLGETSSRFELRLPLNSDVRDTKQTIGEKSEILTGTITPLHVSKYTNELYARCYTESYGLKVAIFRLTGIYGPRQLGGEDHGWIANFAIRTILGLPIKVFGTDKQVRDILYVKDAAQAFHDWFSAECPSGVYNVGGGEPCITSIKQCLQMLSEITGKEQDISVLPSRSGDLWYFCCDISKARETFGWQPKVLPKEGIPELVKWIEENRGLFK